MGERERERERGGVHCTVCVAESTTLLTPVHRWRKRNNLSG